ncbi:recombinase RecA [Candidatus Dependentiae bacterium]|nr:recombinase RecA [Candidatus Dependentiae bacterium]
MTPDKKIKEVIAENPKSKMLESVLAQIDKQHGKGSVMRLGQAPLSHIDAISTGSLLVDHALGIGGFPRGRIIEIYGPEASGKTTLALQVIAQAQKTGGICAFIDAEHALDATYAGKLGININDLLISQPDYGEQALDIAEMLIRSGAIDLIVIDSVAALVPKAELEGDMGDVHMGLQARLMSQALRKLTPVVHKSKTVLVFINQIRSNMNAMAFASKEVTTGGNALKFYASLRVDIRRIESLKKGDVNIGNRVAVKIVKNKMAPPFKRVVVDLMFGEGISKELDLIDAALQYNVLKQSGSWFSYGTERLAQGRDQLKELLKENKELTAALLKKVKAEMTTIPVETPKSLELADQDSDMSTLEREEPFSEAVL